MFPAARHPEQGALNKQACGLPESLPVGRASDRYPAGVTAGGAFFRGDSGLHGRNIDPFQRAGNTQPTTSGAAHQQNGVSAATGENMNQDDEDSRGPINQKRVLSGHLPRDIAVALQQAVHEWPARSVIPRINQLEAECVRRGLRRADPLMGVR